MGKYIDEFKKKQPGLTEGDYDIINREATLEVDKAINEVQKSITAVKNDLAKLKSGRPFNIYRITILIKFESALNDKLNTLISVKSDLF
jgi:hypothetical protein